MTYEEAYKILGFSSLADIVKDGKADREILAKFKMSVIKQIPVAPKECRGNNDSTFYRCNECHSKVKPTQNYCSYCGQSIKWWEVRK